MTSEHPITSAAAVRAALLDRLEIALLDVGDEAVFAQAHPLFAASLPLDRIAEEIGDRIPRVATPIVVYDASGGAARQGADLLRSLGYVDVSLLDGGLEGWRRSGGEIFQDVNTPSKAFGELVESTRHTPSLPAADVAALLRSASNVVVLDARRFSEYRTMSIPGGISVPGGELVYRAAAAAPDPSTFVIVNCAGRTRSIIGAQSLINAGIPNRVAALRNGTMGWLLAGFELDHGRTRQLPGPDASAALEVARRARLVAQRADVADIDREQLLEWLADATRTTYRFDVRTPEEFAEGHLSGFRSAPGGQLVQETDVFAPVRGARIVLVDNDGVRANMTASWLAQMGWDVSVLAEGLAGVSLVRQGSSPAAGAVSSRAARYKRPYEGTDNPQASMQAYLDWELGLVAQLERDGTHHFKVI